MLRDRWEQLVKEELQAIVVGVDLEAIVVRVDQEVYLVQVRPMPTSTTAMSNNLNQTNQLTLTM